MDQNTIDRLVIIALVLSVIAELIGLFAEEQSQILEAKEATKRGKSEKSLAKELQELRQEFETLKLIIKQNPE